MMKEKKIVNLERNKDNIEGSMKRNQGDGWKERVRERKAFKEESSQVKEIMIVVKPSETGQKRIIMTV